MKRIDKRKEVKGMFYYCAKCANIENIKGKDMQAVCKVCGNDMQPVPQKYLMANGSFFKSQESRSELIQAIESGENYDSEIGSKKEEIKKENEFKEQERIDEVNEKMKQEQFHMTCPVCGSKNIQKISTVGKYAKIGVFGILGADDLGKRWRCNVCGSKF